MEIKKKFNFHRKSQNPCLRTFLKYKYFLRETIYLLTLVRQIIVDVHIIFHSFDDDESVSRDKLRILYFIMIYLYDEVA